MMNLPPASLAAGVEQIEPRGDRRWDEFVQWHPMGALFHYSAWRELIARTYRFEPLYLAMTNGHGEIQAALPFFILRSVLAGTRIVSLPQADWACPLITHPDQLPVLLDAAQHVAEACRAEYVEIRTRQCCPYCYIEDRRFQRVLTYKSHIIPLHDGLERTEARLHRSTRQNIRRARREGLRFIRSRDEKDMEVFYDLYLRTRKRQGLVPQPYSFFRTLHGVLDGEGRLMIDFAVHGEKPVAAMVGAVCKNTFHALYEASDPAFLFRRPVHLILWEEIRRAITWGLACFDLGRTARDNEGLLRFKRSWGAEEFDLAYFRYPPRTSRGLLHVREHAPGVIRRVSRRLPMPVLDLAGRMLYRHLG